MNRLLITLAYVVAIGTFALFSLTGPTLIFVAPFLLFTGAGLITGTHLWVDERQRKQRQRARAEADSRSPSTTTPRPSHARAS